MSDNNDEIIIHSNTQFKWANPENTKTTDEIRKLHNRYCEQWTNVSELYAKADPYDIPAKVYARQMRALKQRVLLLKWVLGVEFPEHPLSGVPILDERIDGDNTMELL